MKIKIYLHTLVLLSFYHTTHANSVQAANDVMGDPLEDYFWYQDFGVAIGAGGGFMPEFPGANSYTFSALPVVDINYKRNFFLSTQRGIGAQISPIEHVVMGARVTYDFGRENEDYLQNMNDLSGSVDGGVFLRLMYKPWAWNIDAQTALTSTGHQGSYGGTSLAYEYQYSKDWQLLTRVGASFADDNYMQAYFGVTKEEALNTGFKAYAPSGGFKDADVAVSLTYLGLENWLLFSTVSAGLLGNIPADSDVVQTRMQYKVLFAGSYVF